MIQLVLLLPQGSETRVVRRASFHLYCLDRVLVAILCLQDGAKILERVSALNKNESLVASFWDLDCIQVSLSNVSDVNYREIHLGKGWHETHQQHLAVVRRRENTWNKCGTLDETRDDNCQLKTLLLWNGSPVVPGSLLC